MPHSKAFEVAFELLRVEADLAELLGEMETCHITDRGRFHSRFAELLQRQQRISVPLRGSIEEFHT